MERIGISLAGTLVPLVCTVLAACGGSAERVLHEDLAFSVLLADGWSEPALTAERNGPWFTALRSAWSSAGEEDAGALRVEVWPGPTEESAVELAERMMDAKRRALPGLHVQRLDSLGSGAGEWAAWEALMQLGDEAFRARCWVLASEQGIYAVHLEGPVGERDLLPAAEVVVRSIELEDASDMISLPECDRCDGTGRYREICRVCRGTGRQETRGLFGGTNVLRCTRCGGSGGWTLECPH